MTTDDVYGPYPYSGPRRADPASSGSGRAVSYQVWVSGPQDDSLPSLFSVLEGDRVVRATRRLVIASTESPARLLVTWGSDDTPALTVEGLYRCAEGDRETLVADLRHIFESRLSLRRPNAVDLDGWSDEQFRERVLKAVRETARETLAVSQKAVARMLGTDERTLREECDFRSRRTPSLRWTTLKLDALSAEN